MAVERTAARLRPTAWPLTDDLGSLDQEASHIASPRVAEMTGHSELSWLYMLLVAVAFAALLAWVFL